MKHVLLFITLNLFLTQINCDMTAVSAAMHDCLTKLNIDLKEVNAMENAVMTNTEPSRDGKCLASCTMEKAGLTKDGKIIVDAVNALDPTIASVDLEQCQGLTGSDNCERDYNILKCGVGQYMLKYKSKPQQ